MRLMNSARSGESRREHLHEALVASTTEAQDLLVPLHDRSSNLAISSLLECCFLLRCSAWASQQAYCILVNLIIFFFFLRCFVFITSILDELSDISDKLQQLLFFSHRHFFYSRPWVRWTQLFFCYFLSSLKTSSDAQKSLPLRFSNPRTPPPLRIWNYAYMHSLFWELKRMTSLVHYVVVTCKKTSRWMTRVFNKPSRLNSSGNSSSWHSCKRCRSLSIHELIGPATHKLIKYQTQHEYDIKNYRRLSAHPTDGH